MSWRLIDGYHDSAIDPTLSETVKQALVREGYDPTYGARPLRRVTQRQVENAISKRLLAGEVHEGDTVIVDLTDGGYVFTLVKAQAEAA